MAWRRLGDKQLSEPMVVKITQAYIRYSESMSKANISLKLANPN